jgi:hypothetical protein
LASSSCALYACLLYGAGAHVALATYSVIGTTGLMAFTLAHGLRWSDFR